MSIVTTVPNVFRSANRLVPVLALLAVLLIGTLPATAQERDRNEPAAKRHREGSQIRDRAAQFKIAGDRIEYVPSDGAATMMVLENLALERVKNEVVRVGSAVRWDVIATVMEFEGHNYVLLQRASLTIASQVDP